MSAPRSGGFSPRVMLIVIIFGAAAFLAALYFIGAGETGKRGNDGGAHAASNGLNGFSGFAKLLRLGGRDVIVSRSPTGLKTDGLLIVTPPLGSDGKEIGDLLRQRQYLGPTIVILPKWYATRFPDRIPEQARKQMKRQPEEGWVRLDAPLDQHWTARLPSPFGFTTRLEKLERNDSRKWSGLGVSGELPTGAVLHAEDSDWNDALVTDAAGDSLVVEVIGREGSRYYNQAYWTLFVVEPDLVNNYGLADRSNAKLALELTEYAGNGNDLPVTFDLTLNGFGGTANLLTLAFRPPFLAATLCLILALVIIGWRAFLRFGPPVAEQAAIAAGKRQLVINGAGLIVRARRLRLLADPYIALSARKIGARLGLLHISGQHIDTALSRTLPGETPFTVRAATLRNARGPKDILRAANALKDLERKLDR